MRFLLCALLLTAGCFRWAPTDVAALSKETRSTVRVTTTDQVQVELDDANVENGKVVGVPRDRVRPMMGIDLRPPDIVVADPSKVALEQRKLNGWATAGIVSGAVIATGVSVFFIVVGILFATSSGAMGMVLPPNPQPLPPP